MSTEAKLKCARDYPTSCLQPVTKVWELTCDHGHVVQSGRCAEHGAGEEPGAPLLLICEPCARGRGKHPQCWFTQSIGPSGTQA